MNQEHPRGQRGPLILVADAWTVIMGDKGGYVRFVGKLLLYALGVLCLVLAGMQALSLAKMEGLASILAFLALMSAAMLACALIGTQWLIRLAEHLVLRRPLVLAFDEGLRSKRLWAVAGWRFAYWLPSSILSSMIAYVAAKLVLPFSQTAFTLVHFVFGLGVTYACFFFYLESLRAMFRLRGHDSGWLAIRKRKPALFFLSWVVTALAGLLVELSTRLLPIQSLPVIVPQLSPWLIAGAFVSIFLTTALLGLVLAVAEGLCLKDTLAGHPLAGQGLSSRRSWWYVTRPGGPVPGAEA